MTYKKKTTVAATASAKANKKPVKLTLNEFRAWLSGVEEMQSDDWTPDSTQWKRIRSKIEDIIEGQGSRNFNSGAAGASERYEEPAQTRVVRPSGPSLLNPAALGPAPPPPTFMNMSDQNGSRIKTPNVDTSSGNYASSLE